MSARLGWPLALYEGLAAPAPTEKRWATMAISANPLAEPTLLRIELTPDARFLDLAPPTVLPLMLRVNGLWLLRSEWSLPVCDDDHIEWHLLLQGGGSRGILQLVLLVVAIVYAYYTGDIKGAIQIFAIGSTLVNLLVPIRQPKLGQGTSPGSVYNVQLAGNQARLNEPIPVIYGRMLTFPDFASQPYGEYSNNDQYYFVLLCIGQGNFTVESLQIGNTSLLSFADVNYAILPPGTAPTMVLPNVVNAPEAAGQDIKQGVYVGGYAVCGPGLKVSAVGLDIIFGAGLAAIDGSGNAQNATVVIGFEAQQIDDFGVPVGNWFALGTETITRKSTTPQRITFKYAIATAVRLQVRMVRLNAYIDNLNTANSPTLGGLRGYLSLAVPLSPTATHLEIRMRASSQLSQFAQNRISALVRRKIRTWSPAGGGTWSAEVESRSIGWALADLWTNATYGDGLPDARVDLQTLYDLDQVWTARQDRCDIVFDSKVTSTDAAATIAQVGRARPFARAGVNTLVRDQLQTLPVTAFTSRNMLPGLDIGYSLATEVTADGVLLEYFSNRTWKWETVTCAAPGVVSPVNAPRVRLPGISGTFQATREGLYMAAQNLYRRKMPKWQTELTGLLPAYGSLVLFVPDIPGYAQAGDVTDWNAGTLTMTLSEAPVFTAGAASHYIVLQRDDGSMTGQIPVLPGPGTNDVVLATAPLLVDGLTLMQIVVDDANRERPKYLFGTSVPTSMGVRVLGITKRARDQNGAQIIEMTGVAEDVRIHAVDNAYLPGPGAIQDPVDSSSIPISGGGSGGAGVAIVTLADHMILVGQGTGAGLTASFTLNNTGVASWVTTGTGGGSGNFAAEWLAAATDPATAALYEVRATLISATSVFLVPSTGAPPATYGSGLSAGSAIADGTTWLNLGTARTWAVDSLLINLDGLNVGQRIKLEIRQVGGALTLITHTIDLVVVVGL
jgi:hypothetical protein